MALQELRVCDIYGVTANVQHYHITVIENDQKIIDEELDLCPRAYARFRGWLKRGMMPPPKTKKPSESS